MTRSTPMTVEDRQSGLENVILQHRSFKAALGRLGRLGGRATYPGGLLAGRARVLIGGPGAGKTQLLRAVMAQPWAQARLDGRGGDHRPALYVEVPDTYSERALVAAIMTELGETPPKSWSKEEILAELGRIFHGIGLRVLLLDEAHWMMMSKSTDVQRKSAEFIKSLLNRTGVHIVLAGVTELARLHNAEFGQTRRRLMTKVHLKPYNWSDTVERASFQGILKLYDNALAYAGGCGLHHDDLARRLYLISGGELGVVVQYLSCGVELAEEMGADRITANVLAAVHRELMVEVEAVEVGDMRRFVKASSKDSANPFLCGDPTLERLWALRFHKPPDRSRQTKLKPGEQLAG